MNLALQLLSTKQEFDQTVSDRRPLLGVHPIHDQLAVFNGLGIKGVMIAPYFAKILFEHLIEDTPLSAEVNINRFSN